MENLRSPYPLTSILNPFREMRRPSITHNLLKYEAVRFFYIAKASLAELRTQVQIAYETDSIKKHVYENIETECISLGKMIGKLIKTRKTP